MSLKLNLLIPTGRCPLLLLFLLLACRSGQLVTGELNYETVSIYPDVVLNDVSHHPVGINLNYFMDDDAYLNPKRGTTDALKAMGVSYLRYPGGNKSDFYFFSKPPYEKAEPTLARTGKGATGGRGKMLKNNYTEFKYDVLDFDEFIQMCLEVGAEPVVVVAADEYLVDYPEGSTWSTKEQLLQHAVEWVRYANIKKKYDVKFWMIGNESWHPENENSTAEVYAQDVVDFSKAMKAVDPTIKIIPNGNRDEFNKVVLTMAAGHYDYFAISNYPVFNYKDGYATYRDTLQDLMAPVTRALQSIKQHASPIEGIKSKLIVAEYGPFDWGKKWPFINNMGHALAAFEQTGHQLLEPSIVFSCFWNTRWINNDSESHSAFDALDREGNFNANGYSLMIWGKFLGKKMIKTSSSLHVRTFASLDPERMELYVYIMNLSDEIKNIKPEIDGYRIKEAMEAWELVGENAEDTNPEWREVKETIKNHMQTVPATSIRIMKFALK